MGRRPKSGEVRKAQGNPGHRQIPPVPETSGDAHAVGEVVSSVFKMSAEAQVFYDLIARDLKNLNFVRSSDESLLRRYCNELRRYWKLSTIVDHAGETYECETTNGGTMQRMRPEFTAMLMVSKRLEAMEDRLGLSPVARQQYLIRLMAAGQQPNLPGTQPDEKPGAVQEAALPKPSPVGAIQSRVTH